MLTFGIRFLCENIVAGGLADRNLVEWPPHPARFFMAMAAAHFQTGDDPAERAALEWLELQKPPLITSGEALPRDTVTSYVPVNDDNKGFKRKADGSVSMRLEFASGMGIRRNRQDRTFAKAWLEDDHVWIHWPNVDAAQHLRALQSLCSKVTRIGHSSSLVQMWAANTEAPAPTWTPDPKGRHPMRIFGKGSLESLEASFNRDAQVESQRLRPEMNLSQAYSRSGEFEAPHVPGTKFEDRFITVSLMRRDGPFRQLGLAATLDLTKRCRDALLKHLDGVKFESLTGHNPRIGGRSENPHLAILPLAFVGREHATGGILGLGFALPEGISAEARQQFTRALSLLRSNDLLLGEKGRWSLGPPDDRDTFRPDLWTGGKKGADLWATVTPFVYDRHSKAKDKMAHQEELADSIRKAWDNVKHPDNSAKLSEIIITPVSAHLGALPSHAYPRLRRKDGSECRHCHAILRFNQPVGGPLLLGAGRYRGYGLCRPM